MSGSLFRGKVNAFAYAVSGGGAKARIPLYINNKGEFILCVAATNTKMTTADAVV